MPTIHKKKNNQPKRGNNYDADRRKIYNSERWRRLRAWKVICNPLCEECEQQGITTPAEDVHHIVSFMSVDDPNERKRLAYDFTNLESLCKKCHQKEHN